MHSEVARPLQVDAASRRGGPAPGTLVSEIQALAGMLWRRRGLMLASLLTALAAGMAYLSVFPPTYTATAVLISDPRQQRVVNSNVVLDGIGADVAAVESQVELLRSTDMALRVIEKLNLAEDPEFAPRPGMFGSSDLAISDGMQRAKMVERFLRKLRVARRGLTYVLEVKFNSLDAEKAALIANTVADLYVSDQIAAKKNATAEASDWVKSRIDDLSGRVLRAERAVVDFKAANKIIDLGSDGSGQTLARLEMDRMNQQLMSAEADVALANAKVEQIQRVVDTRGNIEGLPDVLSSVTIQNLRKELTRVLAREASMDTVLGPRHPALIQVREQKARILAEIKGEAKLILAAAKSERDVAVSRVEKLTANLERLKRDSVITGQVGVQLNQLEREAEADRALYAQFLTRAKELSEQRDMQTPDARMIARALAPVGPAFPGPKIILALVVAAGMVAALGAILVLERYTWGRRDEADLKDNFHWTGAGGPELVRRPS